MLINYTLLLDEYQESVNFHYRSGKRPLFIALFLGLATFMMLVGTDFSNTREVITNILTVFFALSFYLLFVRMLTAYQAKKTYNKSPLLMNEVHLDISKKGIKFKQEKVNQRLSWDTFTKWKENEKYYLLYTSHYQFNIIPKRAMSEEERLEFQDYLEKHMSNR